MLKTNGSTWRHKFYTTYWTSYLFKNWKSNECDMKTNISSFFVSFMNGFLDSQRKGLEKRFQIQKYISKPDRKKLAERLGLKDSQVSFTTE